MLAPLTSRARARKKFWNVNEIAKALVHHSPRIPVPPRLSTLRFSWVIVIHSDSRFSLSVYCVSLAVLEECVDFCCYVFSDAIRHC
mmetsp:Transcript_52595/g.44081  ORF Transcript_52595/g.44081 Transcript_52595/m.44081 type:complete len:86 (+) Transcript_52595:464-721(+)